MNEVSFASAWIALSAYYETFSSRNKHIKVSHVRGYKGAIACSDVDLCLCLSQTKSLG